MSKGCMWITGTRLVMKKEIALVTDLAKDAIENGIDVFGVVIEVE